MKRLVIAMLITILCVGCLEREECLRVHQNGTVDAHWRVCGDQDDICQGLRLPAGAPWKISQYLEKKANHPKFHYHAEAQFASMDAYQQATTFGGEDIEMESSLRIVNVPGKTFYHFRRIYNARDWWKFQQAKDRNLPKHLQLRVTEHGLASLKPEEQQKFLAGLASFEREKRMLLVNDVLGRTMIAKPFSLQQLTAIRNQLNAVYVKNITPRRIKQLLAMDESAQTREVQRIQQLLADQEQAVWNNHPEIPYRSYWQQEKNRHALSEDLQDEQFVIRVTLPGQIILTNGAKTSDSEVRWQFPGKELANHHIPLEATSVVEK